MPHSELDALWVKLTDQTISEALNFKPISQLVLATVAKPPLASDPRLAGDTRLWTEKYKPTSLAEIIGQGSQIQNLVKWLESWQDVHVHGHKHEVKGSFHPNSWQSGTLNSKAALVSGEPGIGKTTAAKMVAELCKYSWVEFNASDIRNKSSVLTIEFDSFTLDKDHQNHRRVVIMDEVDGMSSGDRGGIQAIIQMIKKARCPIICICNDRQHDKIRTLATHCYDIKFFKPDKRMVVRRLKEIL